MQITDSINPRVLSEAVEGGVAVHVENPLNATPLSFNPLWRNRFWAPILIKDTWGRDIRGYVNLRSLEKRATPKVLQIFVGNGLPKRVGDAVAKVLPRETCIKLGISEKDYQFIRANYGNVTNLPDQAFSSLSQKAQKLLKIARALQKCDPAIPFEDFVELSIQTDQLREKHSRFHKGRALQTRASLVKAHDRKIYATFSKAQEATAFLGSGSFKTVTKAVCMDDGEIVACAKMEVESEEFWGVTSTAEANKEGSTLFQFKDTPNVVKLLATARNISRGNRTWQDTNGHSHSSKKPEKRYWFFPLYEGGTLTSFMSKEPLTGSDKRRVALETIDAVKTLHDKTLYHFDLKPDNFLVDGEGRVVVSDIGFASSSFVRPGTYTYLSPEGLRTVLQEEFWRFQQANAPKIDVWALGCTVYELFTGRMLAPWDSNLSALSNAEYLFRLFSKPDFHTTLTTHLAEAIPGAKNAKIREILQGMLTVDPRRRWSLDQVHRELQTEQIRWQPLEKVEGLLSTNAEEALTEANSISDPIVKSLALSSVAIHFRDRATTDDLARAFKIGETIPDANIRLETLTALSTSLVSLGTTTIEEAFIIANSISDEPLRLQALTALSTVLVNLQHVDIDTALALAQTISNEALRSQTQAALFEALKDPQKVEPYKAFAIAVAISDPTTQFNVLSAVTPHLQSAQDIVKALQAARDIRNPHLRASTSRSLLEAFGHAHEVDMEEAFRSLGAITNESSRTELLQSLVDGLVDIQGFVRAQSLLEAIKDEAIRTEALSWLESLPVW